MKITIPPDKPRFDARRNHRRGPGNPGFLHQRYQPSNQKPQSPIKEWADFTPAERIKILEKLNHHAVHLPK